MTKHHSPTTTIGTKGETSLGVGESGEVRKKHAGGRPSTYKPEYCDEIVKYFDIEPHFETPVEKYDKEGNLKETRISFVPSDLPTFAGFASSIGVWSDKLNKWAKKDKKFRQAIKRCKSFQEKILVTNALRGEYSPAFSIFFAKNNLGWKDRQDITTGDKPLENLVVYRPERSEK